ncbi:MAG: hypothetical protein ACK5LT_12855, partial [Lachnospirales bacterium]
MKKNLKTMLSLAISVSIALSNPGIAILASGMNTISSNAFGDFTNLTSGSAIDVSTPTDEVAMPPEVELPVEPIAKQTTGSAILINGDTDLQQLAEDNVITYSEKRGTKIVRLINNENEFIFSGDNDFTLIVGDNDQKNYDVIFDNFKIKTGITVNGATLNLTLKEGSENSIEAPSSSSSYSTRGVGILLNEEANLNINSSEENVGKLDVKSSASGIGSYYANTETGKINIWGGIINVEADDGAGIGVFQSSINEINIFGGTITSTCGENGAGIGSASGELDSINISGGTITAEGVAGIGFGFYTRLILPSDPVPAPDYLAEINISGGTITAKGSTGIGSGGKRTRCNNISIYGGDITATGTGGPGIGAVNNDIYIGKKDDLKDDIKITARGNLSHPGIGASYKKDENRKFNSLTIDEGIGEIDTDGIYGWVDKIIINSGNINSTGYGVGIGGVFNEVIINGGTINVDKVYRGYVGIGGKGYTIEDENGTTIPSSITINDGEITAKCRYTIDSKPRGVGIGVGGPVGGSSPSIDNIIINDGTVEATGFNIGIGTGVAKAGKGSIGNIEIHGGTVESLTGMGAGDKGDTVNNIRITNGSVDVKGTLGNYIDGTVENISIEGGKVYVSGAADAIEGDKIAIYEGADVLATTIYQEMEMMTVYGDGTAISGKFYNDAKIGKPANLVYACMQRDELEKKDINVKATGFKVDEYDNIHKTDFEKEINLRKLYGTKSHSFAYTGEVGGKYLHESVLDGEKYYYKIEEKNEESLGNSVLIPTTNENFEYVNLEKYQVPTPTISGNIYSVDSEISGTGEVDAIVTIYDGKGTAEINDDEVIAENVKVNADGVWTYSLVDGKEISKIKNRKNDGNLKGVESIRANQMIDDILVSLDVVSDVIPIEVTIEDVCEGQKELTGTGVFDITGESKVSITVKDKTYETEVTEDGSWKIDMGKAEADIVGGDTINVTQTFDGRKLEDSTVVSVNISDKPEINRIFVGDSKITGKGQEESANIRVTLNDGTEFNTKVDENLNWSVDLTAQEDKLIEGETVSAVQKRDIAGARESEPADRSICKAGGIVVINSDKPQINRIFVADSKLTGKGQEDSANIKVTLNDGTEFNTKVDENLNWSVDLTGQEDKLIAGET